MKVYQVLCNFENCPDSPTVVGAHLLRVRANAEAARLNHAHMKCSFPHQYKYTVEKATFKPARYTLKDFKEFLHCNFCWWRESVDWLHGCRAALTSPWKWHYRFSLGHAEEAAFQLCCFIAGVWPEYSNGEISGFGRGGEG